MKKIIKTSFFLILLSFLSIIASNYIISKTAYNKVFNSTMSIPKNRVGLILGAGKVTSHGRINLYYKYRLEAAINLFKSGKIDFILISGDNSRKDYDEPSTFKKDLIKNGIPENKIFLDYAGFRTLDSVIRAKKVFGLTNLTFISQQFHNERAVFLAKQNGIDAIGFNAKDVHGSFALKTNLREYLARTKAIFDVVFKIQPRFLGEKIAIE